MNKYIRLRNHKILKQVYLSNLGNINIICGKNNSGKTTVLEALCDENCIGLGKPITIDDIDWIVTLFEPQAKRYSKPNPANALRWLRQYLTSLESENSIWYSDDLEEIKRSLLASQKSDQYLRSHAPNTYSYDEMLNKFFEKSRSNFVPILIPPKRYLSDQVKINLEEELTPTGEGIVNKLFYLKNQDLESTDYDIYMRIYETFTLITNSKFNIVPNRNNEINLLFKTDDNWIPAKDCGLGLSDVLIIVSLLEILKNTVILIEEPENHLHAEYQRRLLKYFSSLKECQIFITTHSAVFLNPEIVDKILYCSNEGEIKLSDHTSKSEIISSLGYSVTENLTADLIILLEGPSDIPVIKEMLRWKGIDDLFSIKYWPLGGDIMASLDLSIFSESKCVYALVDSDPGSSVTRTRFIKNCRDLEIKCRKLERYSIENYFPIGSIRKAFPKQIPASIKEIKPDESVDKQIGFKDKNKTIKIRNDAIVKSMVKEDIAGTDLAQALNEMQELISG